jgi:DNA-binding CsgD family transcriptional regulator
MSASIGRHSDEAAHVRRITRISQRREAPRFLICDAFMNLIFASPEIDLALSSKETLALLAHPCQESRAGKATVFHTYDNETVLRIIPLDAALAGCVAIFVDSFSHRGSIFEAAKTFGLTKRESEVLQLLVRGKTNSEIAETLSVAESTVGDHVKSVMRKAKTSKRVELISRVFDLDHDLAQQA